MAKAANAENVNQSRQAPDARYAVQTIRGNIKKKKDRVSGINGEINAEWEKMQARGIDKVGARLWAALDKLEPDERRSAMRTFNDMCDVSEWPEQQADLVDTAQNKVVPMRMKTVDQESLDGSEEEIRELEEEAEAAKLKKPSFGDGSVLGAAVDPEEQARRDAEFEDAAPEHQEPDFND